MTNEIAVQQDTMSVDSVVVQRKKMLEIQARVMQKGVDYGLVPGCPKPSLFKPGAEKLCATFMIAVNPMVEDLSTGDERKYRVTVNLTHQSTGVFLGAGIGEASTSEKKYKWRKAVCAAEFEATDPDRRKIEYKSDGETIQQVRTEPADLANTVLKMAKKRAQIDAVLTVLGASDLFTQDVEDIPAEYLNQGKPIDAKPKPSTPKAKPAAGEQSKILCKVSRAFERKNSKAPFSFGVTTPEGERIEGYFQTRDENIVSAMERHIGDKDTVELSYHVEMNGQYTNIVIDEISAIADNGKDDRNAD